MAQADVQWPSEDEDFDAVSGGAPVTATATEEQVPKPAEAEVKAVKISMPDDEKEPEAAPAPEPAAEPEAPEEPAEPEEPEMPVAKPEPQPAPMAPKPPMPPKPAVMTDSGDKRVGRTLLEVVLVLLVVGLGLWSWTLYSDRSSLRKQVTALNNNPQAVIQKQTQDLLDKVGKLYNLPTGETPTIANVTDAAAAKKQSSFFTDAQNGDKVLMYVKAGVAILYRPSTNKIVLVAPLTFTNSAATATTTPSPTPKH